MVNEEERLALKKKLFAANQGLKSKDKKPTPDKQRISAATSLAGSPESFNRASGFSMGTNRGKIFHQRIVSNQ